MNRHRSPGQNTNSRVNPNQSSRSSNASARSSSTNAKPSQSSYANNNVVGKGSTTTSLGSNNRPVTASSSAKGKAAVFHQKRPTTTPLGLKAGLVIPPSSVAAQAFLENQSRRPQFHINYTKVQKIYTAQPVRTSSSMSLRSNSSGKGRSSSVPPQTSNHQQQLRTASNTNTNILNSANNNFSTFSKSPEVVIKPQSAGPATATFSNLGATLASTQLIQQPRAQMKLPFPSPISHQRHLGSMTRSTVLLEKSRNFRTFVEKAINEHKIFSCCGVYPAIKTALRKRGWVEKPGPLAYSRSTSAALYHTKNIEDESDTAWMTRILKDYPADFIWVIRRDNIDWKHLTQFQMINRFPKAWFTTKTGLAACLQHMHWFSEAGVSDTFFPRCYRLCLEEERQAFQDDYRLTACMSFLRYFINAYEMRGTNALADPHSKITPLAIDFACRQLGNYMRMRRHEDIDWLLPPNFMTQHWDAFIHQYYAVVHEKKKMRFDKPEAVRAKYDAAKKMLHKVVQFWPQFQLDGVYNMWICKPGARSRGNGIVIKNNLEKIMDLMSQNNFRECNWVVQKYIERPLLLYKTKFDIRQWFLVTDWTPLTVWFYRESYIRFCTKPFILEDFHESIHLCNNAIQVRYQNAAQRDPSLPQENMWSSDTFQSYLKSQKRADAWPLIYSGMKQAIVGVLLSSQEIVENRKGCYELYGADFMLTEDFRPWLIEINSCPCMAPTTSVTTRMCAQCLEDTIKVVVDRKHNRNAETGQFELIYRQNAGSLAGHEFNGHEITVIGKRLTRDVDWPMPMVKATKGRSQTQGASLSNAMNGNSNTPGNSKDPGKQTLSDLLQKLRVRNPENQGVGPAQLGLVIEKTPDNGSILDKMMSFKTFQTLEKEKAIINNITNAALQQKVLGGIIRPSASSSPGKGEDPSPVPSKFIEMNNSYALLLKNTQGNALSDLLKVGKDAAQELLNRSKVLKDTKSEGKHSNPPKTLAEAKAMVESTMTSRGKPSSPPTPKQHQNSKLQEEEDLGAPTSSSSTSDGGLQLKESKPAIKGASMHGILRARTPPPPPLNLSSNSERDTRLLSKSESDLEVNHGSDSSTPISVSGNGSNSNLSTQTCSSVQSSLNFRRTKSLSFALQCLSQSHPRYWLSERDFDFLKSKPSVQSVPSSVSQRSFKLRYAPSYMIYPEPAHEFNETPDGGPETCPIVEERHYNDGVNSTTPSHADITEDYNSNDVIFTEDIIPGKELSLSRIEEVQEDEDILQIVQELREEIITKVEDEQTNSVIKAVSESILEPILDRVIGESDIPLQVNLDLNLEQPSDIYDILEPEPPVPSPSPPQPSSSALAPKHQNHNKPGKNDQLQKPNKKETERPNDPLLINLSDTTIEDLLARARQNVQNGNGANQDGNENENDPQSKYLIDNQKLQ